MAFVAVAAAAAAAAAVRTANVNYRIFEIDSDSVMYR